MQVIRTFEAQSAAQVGLGIRVMMITGTAQNPVLAQRIAGMGGFVEAEGDLYHGLEQMIEDPAGYGLCVIDCDAVGGLEVARRAQKLLGEVALRVPVILVSNECSTQEFPQQRGKPVVLRGSVSSVSMRVGFEHALRDRYVMRLI
jgi:hypothetical protein